MWFEFPGIFVTCKILLSPTITLLTTLISDLNVPLNFQINGILVSSCLWQFSMFMGIGIVSSPQSWIYNSHPFNSLFFNLHFTFSKKVSTLVLHSHLGGGGPPHGLLLILFGPIPKIAYFLPQAGLKRKRWN